MLRASFFGRYGSNRCGIRIWDARGKSSGHWANRDGVLQGPFITWHPSGKMQQTVDKRIDVRAVESWDTFSSLSEMERIAYFSTHEKQR